MPRIARAVAVGFPHHITQRGNYRQAVFETDGDYVRYLELLKHYSEKHSLKIWAYCLMGNHVHFIAVPMGPDSLSKVFKSLHMRYSQYFNMKNKMTGHLWQGRFYSCALDEKHLYAAMQYVENNPVRARIVRTAEKYHWSSARFHIMKTADAIISKDCYLTKEIKDWLSYLKEQEDSALVDELKKSTKTGRPCGDETFIGKLEKSFGRRLGALSWGRPRKGTK